MSVSSRRSCSSCARPSCGRDKARSPWPPTGPACYPRRPRPRGWAPVQGRSTPRDPRERKRKKRHFTRAHRPAGVIASAPFEPDALRRPGFAPVRGRAALLGSCFRVTGQTPAPAASTRRPRGSCAPQLAMRRTRRRRPLAVARGSSSREARGPVRIHTQGRLDDGASCRPMKSSSPGPRPRVRDPR